MSIVKPAVDFFFKSFSLLYVFIFVIDEKRNTKVTVTAKEAHNFLFLTSRDKSIVEVQQQHQQHIF
ncbi:MAG: hypothetical protein ACI8RD_005644 [Bacillariaceae sp.]|jgi:hypothetical protein